MSGLIEAATAILGASERQLEIAAHNVANVSTPGYKRRVGFADLLSRTGGGSSLPQIAERSDFAQGKLTPTGNPLDLALTGDGFFQVRAGNQLLYSRQGQFRRAPDGTLVNLQGHVLQDAAGGDLVTGRAEVKIAEDGAVLEEGRPVARVAVVSVDAMERVGETHFAGSAALVEEPGEVLVRQGMVEASNVAMGDEMVTMMGAMRRAETGARLVQVYDELMGRALTTLGQGGR